MSSTELPTAMKAATYTSTAPNITLNPSHPLPKLATALPPNSSLIRVSHASLNPVDYKISEIPLIGRLVFSSGIPGLDFAGTVVQTTSSDFKPGEKVFGMLAPPFGGSLGEFIVVKHGAGSRVGCVRVPPGVELRDAATLGVAGLTALQSLGGFVERGDGSKKVFINGGSGGVGTYQIQIAKLLGFYVVVSCSGANADFCKSLGADEVIDYRTQNLVETLVRGGTRFDLIVDNVFGAGAELYWNCAKYLKPEGTYVTIAGSASVATVRNFLGIMFLPKFLGGGERKFKFLTCVANSEDLTRVAGWMAEGKLRACVEKEFDLRDAGEAFLRLKTGRTRGKLVVRVA